MSSSPLQTERPCSGAGSLDMMLHRRASKSRSNDRDSLDLATVREVLEGPPSQVPGFLSTRVSDCLPVLTCGSELGGPSTCLLVHACFGIK